MVSASVQQEIVEEKGQGRLSERVDTFCARAILLVFLFILAWGPLAFGGKFPAGFLVIEGATLAALALWMVRIWVQRPFRLLWPPVCWGVLAFVLYAVARCRSVEVEYAGRQQLIRVLVYGALFFLALNNLNRKRSATIVSLTLIAVGCGVAMMAVFQYASNDPLVWGTRKMDQFLGRATGTFMNPDHMAGFLGMTLPLALAYTVTSRLSATVKALLGYSVVVMLAGIAVSVSRGAIVATAVALVLFCAVLLTHRDFWRAGLVVLAFLIVLGGIAMTQIESIQKRFDVAFAVDRAGDERIHYWRAAMQLFSDHPVLGIGPGHFDVEFPSVRPWEVQHRPTYAHNDYLNTLCDWGCVGFGIIAGACGLLGWGVLQVWRNLRRPSRESASGFSDRTAFVVGGTVSLAAVMVHCIVEFNMQIPASAVTAVTLMALLAAQARFATERYWQNPGRFGKILLTAMAASAMAYLSAQGARKTMETYWLARANTANTPPASTIAFLTKAHEAEPIDYEMDYYVAEYLWQLSLLDDPNYLDKVSQSLAWYAKAMELDQFDAYAPIGCGMCLDRLGHPQEATPYFLAALHNDPHNCFVSLEIARHCIEMGELEAAKRWLWEGALRREATPAAIDECGRLQRLMANPIFLAGINNLTKTNAGARNIAAPLLAGPK